MYVGTHLVFVLLLETVKLSEENCDTMKKHILQNILEEECAKIRQRMNVNQSAVTFEVKQFSRKTVLLENELFMGEDLLEDTVEKVCSDIAHKLCRQINNTLDPIYINTNVLNETRRIHCDHFSGNCCTTKSLDKIINRECLRILKQDFEFISYIIDFVAITEERLNIKCKIKDYEKKRSNLSVLSRKRMLKETKNVVYNLSGENCEKFNFLIEDLLLYDYSFNLNDELYDFLDIDMYTNILPMANWIYCLEEGKEMRSEYRHLLDSLSLARRSIIKTIIDCLYTFYELCDQDKIGLNFDCYMADYVEMCLYNNNIEDTLYDIICRSCAYNNVYFIPEFIALDYANGSNRIISRDVDVRYYIEYYVLWQAFDLMPSALASYENYSSSNLAKLQSKFEISSNNIRSKVINTKIDLAEPKAVVNKEIVIKKKIKKVELKKVPKLIEEPQLTCNSKKIENNEIDDWRQCAQYVLELLAKHKERNCDNNNNGKLGSFVGKLQNLESIKNCFLGIGAIVIVAVSIIFELFILEIK